MMDLRSPNVFRTLLLVAATCVVPRLCAAQAAAAGSRSPGPSKVDIYGGYGYLRPFNSDIYNVDYTPISAGMVTSVTGYFNRSFGLQGEYSKFFNDPDYCFGAVQGGPVFRHQVGRIVPFVHLIGGAAQVGLPYVHNGSSNSCNWGWTATGGVGIDYILPALNNHLALRLAGGLSLVYAF
jgi:hypothetical protein